MGILGITETCFLFSVLSKIAVSREKRRGLLGDEIKEKALRNIHLLML